MAIYENNVTDKKKIVYCEIASICLFLHAHAKMLCASTQINNKIQFV